jgi:antitoxin component HigA of HigAB toxin-antitoxin module
MPNPVEMIKTEMSVTGRSLRAQARVMGIAATYLSHLLRGERSAGPKVLGYLGLKAQTRTTYHTERR